MPCLIRYLCLTPVDMLERFDSLATKYPLDIVTHLVILLPLLIGLFRYRYLKPEMKWVMGYFATDFIAETVSLLLMLRGGTTLHIQDIRSCLNMVMLAGIYHAALIRPGQKKVIVAIGAAGLVLGLVFYTGDSVSPWVQTVFRIYAMGAALTYYNAILSDLNLKKLQHHSLFWFSAGLLFYAGGTLFTMLFNQYLYDEKTSDAVFDKYWNLMQILYILFCLVSALGLWVSKNDRNNQFEHNYFQDEFFGTR